ncbi:MAG: heavy metal translocating P-type ATPase [Paraperlucidibaca sp.]
MTDSCFHCGLPNPTRLGPFQAVVLSEMRAFCCPGCLAVAESIESSGLSDYYLSRDSQPGAAFAAAPAELLSRFDHAAVQREFVSHDGELSMAELSIENLSCAACAWLIERRLQQTPGVIEASVNYSNHRLRVRWHDQQTHLSHVLIELERIGYKARPFQRDTHAAALKQQARTQLFRVALAGLGTMQAMMLGIALYLGAFQGIDIEYRDYMRWISGMVTLPVFAWAGWPFYRAAWQALKARHLTMDVPVSIALWGAFFASWYATLIGQGETYFDSVCMFIFFLQTSRFVELKARQRAGERAADLLTINPRLVKRWQDGHWQSTPSDELVAGERILIDAGDTVAVDAQLEQDMGYVSEAMLTGEPMALRKRQGEMILAGSIAGEQALIATVVRSGNDTVLATLHQLMSRALAEKPALAQRADSLAHWFVARVLVLAVCVYIGWQFVDPAQAFWATLAVLVATCPCALSLATPTALTVATQRLAELGFLVTRGHVLSTLPEATHIVFDKTGTLTVGSLQVSSCELISALQHADNIIHSHAPREQALSLVAAMETGASHPIARSLCRYIAAQGIAATTLTAEVEAHAGLGLSVQHHDACYRIGHAAFALAKAPTEVEDTMVIWLSKDHAPLLRIGLSDQLRPEAAEVIASCRARGLTTVLLSGDASTLPERMGRELGIDIVHGQQNPEQKQARIAAWQAEGAIVVMVGDGINDAASLGQAHCGVAMGSGTDWAHTSADAVLLGDRLVALIPAFALAEHTAHRVKQNMRWAVGYNLAILPPAALGFVAPWAAALGMSLSSLVVVFNALRLRRVALN